LLPPVTGTYTFWIAADDTATLLLGTNDTPASARQIAFVNSAPDISARQWEIQTNQRSAPITLVAGQQYYIEALMKDAISFQYPPDHLEVRWQLPDGSIDEPLSAAHVTPHGMTGPRIATQ